MREFEGESHGEFEKSINNARVTAMRNIIASAKRGDFQAVETAAKQIVAIAEIDQAQKSILAKYGVSDIIKTESLGDRLAFVAMVLTCDPKRIMKYMTSGLWNEKFNETIPLERTNLIKRIRETYDHKTKKWKETAY